MMSFYLFQGFFCFFGASVRTGRRSSHLNFYGDHFLHRPSFYSSIVWCWFLL